MSTFSEDVLPAGEATVLDRPYIGYKWVNTKHQYQLGIARVRVPPCGVVFRPRGELIEWSDLRCDEYTIEAIWALADDAPMKSGIAPVYSKAYEVGRTYRADEFDYTTCADCMPGLHFFATLEAAMLYAMNKNGPMHWACKTGNQRLIDLLIANGNHEWNDGLLGAARGGHVDIATLMITRGAINVHRAFIVACEYGHLDLVKFIAAVHGPAHYCMYWACVGGNMKIVEYLVDELGLSSVADLKLGLDGALCEKRADIADWLRDRIRAQEAVAKC